MQSRFSCCVYDLRRNLIPYKYHTKRVNVNIGKTLIGIWYYFKYKIFKVVCDCVVFFFSCIYTVSIPFVENVIGNANVRLCQ